MKLFKFSVIIFTMLVVGVLYAGENDVQEVTAEGSAVIVGNNIKAAKRAALNDAKRNAVDQVGSEVVAQTVVSNYELVKDKIISKVSGYVHGYKILKEGKEGKNYVVKIKAKVSTKAIKDDATMIYNEMDKPRIIIIVPLVKDGKTLTSSQAENTLAEYFKEKGFDVLDAATVKANIKKDKLRAISEGNDKEAAKLGLQAGAEVIITGQALVGKAESVQNILFGAKSTVTLRAINTANGRLYAAGSVDGNGVDAVADGAVRKAIETASKKAADSIFWKIVKDWNNEKLNGATIELVIRGVNYSRLKKAVKLISKLDGVKSVIKRSFDSPVAVLSVTFMGNGDRLAELLDEKRIGGKKVEINSVSPGKVEIKLK